MAVCGGWLLKPFTSAPVARAPVLYPKHAAESIDGPSTTMAHTGAERRPHKHKDLAFWISCLIAGGFRTPSYVAFLCICGLLGP